MIRSDHDLLALALDWHEAGRKVAIATVLETWGSAPRGVGSLLVMDDAGAMEGSVSGGCVEGAVMVEAMDALSDGKPRVLEYGVSDDTAFEVGLACGGTIRILVEAVGASMGEDILRSLVASKLSAKPAAYVVDLESNARRVSDASEYVERFRLDRSGIEEDGRTFVAIHNPPLRLFIVGAVHIAQHLAPMARAVGMSVTVIDPREAFADAARFPDETLVHEWPDEAIDALAPNERTAIVTLTHDPKLDDPALQSALKSKAFYIGCLGSKRTHAKRVTRLEESGWTVGDIDRLHAPIGLPLGGRAPAEIAVSVIAEIVQSLRSAK